MNCKEKDGIKMVKENINKKVKTNKKVNDVLTMYKNRLVNLSSRNRSLRLGKLAKVRNFDMQKIELYDIKTAPEIMKQVFKSKKADITIELIPNMSQAQDCLFDKSIINVRNWEEKQVDEITQTERDQRLNQERYKLTKQGDELNNSLLKLSKNITDQIKETGINNLYVGYLFVRGKLADETKVTAPLLLFPAELSRGQAKSWNLKIETEPVLNKVLILALQNGNNMDIDIDSFEQAFEWKDWKGKDWQEFSHFFATNGLEFVRKTTEFSPFQEQTVAEFEQEYAENQQLELHYQIVLGDFPVANAIYENYEVMITEKLCTQEIKNLLAPSDSIQKLPVTFEDANEKEQYFISPLDASQEQAVMAIKQNSSMVVYGPPGTGKSQMITNLIADMVAQNKRVLMVSQKKVAIDVIASRLGNISGAFMSVTNTNNDKKNVYQKILQLIEQNTFTTEITLEQQYQKIGQKVSFTTERINESIAKLDEIAKFLHKQHSIGLTLQQMYAQIGSEHKSYPFRADFEHIIKDYAKIFSRYSRLETYVTELFSEGYLSDIYRVQQLECNPYMAQLENQQETVKVFELEELIHELEEVLLRPAGNSSFSLEVEAVTENRVTLQWQLENFTQFIKHIREKNIQNQLAALNQNPEELTAFIKELRWICTPELFSELELAISTANYPVLLASIDSIQTAIATHDELQELQNKLSNLKVDEYSLLKKQTITQPIERAELLFQSLIELLLMKKSKEIEAENRKVINYMKSFEQIQETIYEQLDKKSKEVVEYIQLKNQRALKQLMNTSEGKNIKSQVQKKRMSPSLRQLLAVFADELLTAVPCWLMTPETVADIMPLTHNLFDLVIFDEASQILVESAIPTIYRGKKIVIVGDDKQLPPSDLFIKRGEEDDEDEIELLDAVIQEKSLLDIAKVQYPDVRLNYHYRADRSELIQFSNAAYYGGNLDVSPDVEYAKTKRAIQRFKVENARFENTVNEVEAKEIVKLVATIFKKRSKNQTIGIIVFNAKQKELVEDLLEGYAQQNSDFQRAYNQELNRIENGEDVSLFVKNIENVQGDERDIIILGTTYAENNRGTLSANFGTLTHQGGENRLNVAISRAKKKIYVVTSFEPEQLNVQNSKNLGPKLFRKYLEYVRAVDQQDLEQAKTILDSVIETNSTVTRMYEQYANGANIQLLIQRLSEKGYSVQEKVGTTKYGFDIAIYDKVKEKYLLGIEFDETPYHIFSSTRERDVFNRRFLNARGWKVLRVWSKDLAENMTRVVNTIVKAIEK